MLKTHSSINWIERNIVIRAFHLFMIYGKEKIPSGVDQYSVVGYMRGRGGRTVQCTLSASLHLRCRGQARISIYLHCRSSNIDHFALPISCHLKSTEGYCSYNLVKPWTHVLNNNFIKTVKKVLEIG